MRVVHPTHAQRQCLIQFSLRKIDQFCLVSLDSANLSIRVVHYSSALGAVLVSVSFRKSLKGEPHVNCSVAKGGPWVAFYSSGQFSSGCSVLVGMWMHLITHIYGVWSMHRYCCSVITTLCLISGSSPLKTLDSSILIIGYAAVHLASVYPLPFG